MANELHEICSSGRLVARAMARPLHYPDAHAEGVTDLAQRVALQLDVPQALVRIVAVGALIHDIGKLAIDARVLHKPGPLDENDWRAVRQHPAEGVRLLTGVFADEALAVVRWHHERWDGQGYPDGLAGTDIPLQARIVAVADAYRAMRERRPYRSAISTAEAVRELERGASRQFDPDCVTALLASVAA